MTLPEHIKKVSSDRAAIAPYNFVPLPEKIVPAEPDFTDVDHDRYYSIEGEKPRYTGHIECVLTTASPLYVRCGYTLSEYKAFGDKPFHDLSDQEKSERARFFHYSNPDRPRIPGSSLRGMLRALVEIASYSKMDKVTDRQLFYRDVRNADYRKAFADAGARVDNLPSYVSLVHAGFLRKRSNGYVIEECNVVRIYSQAGHAQIASIPARNGVQYQPGQSANFRPDWQFQHQTIYVNADAAPQAYGFNNKFLEFRAVHQADWQPQPGFSEGTLVITGHMQNKHMEFVFLHTTIATHQLNDDLVQRFEDEDQITAWQEQAFPVDQPYSGARKRNGLLRDGEPVFFLLDETGILFFGRAQLFRRPYGSSPYTFIPSTVRFGRNGTETLPDIDLSEAIFGQVPPDRTDLRKPIAGRVFVSDATLVAGQTNVLFERPLTPRILGSPKPTTFQHYLVQPNEIGAAQKNLHGYDSAPGKTTIRGHKLYWHQNNVSGEAIREANQQKIQRAPKQYTQLQPVKENVVFSFDIRFENLSSRELGALLWVLRLAAHERYRLKLGMGKPLGMGAVRIEHKLLMTKRTDRYNQLFDDSGGWFSGNTPVTSKQADDHTAAFERYVLTHSEEKAEQLADTLRIRCLLTLLTWPGPDPAVTRSMEIERDATYKENILPAARQNRTRWSPERQVHVVNEYYTRPVLPMPIDVYPEQEHLQNGVKPVTELQTAPLHPQTVQARVGGVGVQDASVIPVDGSKPGRARFAPNLSRRVKAGDMVLVQLSIEGRPEVIIALL